jgi:hypothetical protein
MLSAEARAAVGFNRSRIIDIGEPPGVPPSAFCNMELSQEKGYWNYIEDPQP